MRKLLILFVLIISLFVSSCSSLNATGSGSGVMSASLVQTALVGAAAGGLLGAGAGAIVGSIITNGDPALSALLGAGIGVPVGAAVSAGYQNYKQNKILSKNDDLIRSNYNYIVTRQKDIDDLREKQVDESYMVNPSKRNRGDIFIGPTI